MDVINSTFWERLPRIISLEKQFTTETFRKDGFKFPKRIKKSLGHYTLQIASCRFSLKQRSSTQVATSSSFFLYLSSSPGKYFKMLAIAFKNALLINQ
jgi:hypothetical protein